MDANLEDRRRTTSTGWDPGVGGRGAQGRAGTAAWPEGTWANVKVTAVPGP